MIERIEGSEHELALILRRSYSAPGISFLTSPESEFQLGYMRRDRGYSIEPHLHCELKREVCSTQEVLYIKRGRVRADFYDNDKSFVASKTLNSGDVILLIAGGHGFEILEDAEIIEVKQGPYAGDGDKIRFAAAPPNTPTD